jgi:hypothetical protein
MSAKVTKDGMIKELPERVAKHAVKSFGWVYYVEAPLPETESLTDLKARIKESSLVEIGRILNAEQKRTTPRASVIELCNKLISEWPSK